MATVRFCGLCMVVVSCVNVSVDFAPFLEEFIALEEALNTLSSRKMRISKIFSSTNAPSSPKLFFKNDFVTFFS